MNNYDDVKATAAGKVIPLSAVNDPMFAREMLGAGFAVIPEDDVIVSLRAANIPIVLIDPAAAEMDPEQEAERLAQEVSRLLKEMQ